MDKYWHLLSMGPESGPHVSDKPAITYRRAKSLREYLVHSEFTAGSKKDPCKYPGTFRCGGCNYCQFMQTERQAQLPNGAIFKHHHFANCKTPGVIYVLTCKCGFFYVGKTIQEFQKHAYRHVLRMKSCNPDLPWGRHVTAVHNGEFPRIKFPILDRVHPPHRGSDWNKKLLQCELRWIYHLGATSSLGMNKVTNFKPFLESFTSGGWER